MPDCPFTASRCQTPECPIHSRGVTRLPDQQRPRNTPPNSRYHLPGNEAAIINGIERDLRREKQGLPPKKRRKPEHHPKPGKPESYKKPRHRRRPPSET